MRKVHILNPVCTYQPGQCWLAKQAVWSHSLTHSLTLWEDRLKSYSTTLRAIYVQRKSQKLKSQAASVTRLLARSIDRSINQLINQTANQSINQSINKLINIYSISQRTSFCCHLLVSFCLQIEKQIHILYNNFVRA